MPDGIPFSLVANIFKKINENVIFLKNIYSLCLWKKGKIVFNKISLNSPKNFYRIYGNYNYRHFVINKWRFCNVRDCIGFFQ